jgi:hypothetical protein
VVLVSDGGADHRGIARHFGCSYKHEERIGNGYNLASFSFERGLAYLLRFFSAIHGIRQHWVMLLEDDVRVERAVETSQLRHTVNGCRTDMGVPLPLALALRNHGSAVSLPVQPMSFFGGTIFDRGFFLRVGPEAMVSAFAELFPVLERTNPFWTQDSVLTAITLRLGGTVGSWPGYSQVHWPWYPFHRLFGTIEVLHGYKAWYGRPLSDPERALLDGHSVAALPPDQDDLLEHHLAALERICCQAYVQHGQIPEGSLFTRDFVRDPRLVEKQSNLRALLDRPRRYLETGFNSGQSALLVLSAHEENSILSFDIGRRAYERPCAAYLGQAFPAHAARG